MERMLWIGAGGFAGTCARYLLSGWITERFGASFPWGTLAVNAIGSLLLGALMWIGLNTHHLGATLGPALTTGVMGGFTTYSTFNFETLYSFQERAWRTGFLNMGATLVGCLLAGLLGWAGAAAIFSRTRAA